MKQSLPKPRPATEDDVLRRMLATPPRPHKRKAHAKLKLKLKKRAK